MEKHLSRKQLIEASRIKSGKVHDHLKTCQECRFLYSVFAKIEVGNEQLYSNAPEHFVRKAMKIADRSTIKEKLLKIKAVLSFDSWTSKPALEVRNGELNTRRLSFKFDELSLDFQASRKKTDWQFVAKLSDKSLNQCSYIKSTSKLNIYPDENGYFIWNENEPPEKIMLFIDKKQILIPKIKWKNN